MTKNKKKQAKNKEEDEINSSDMPPQRATKTHVNYRDKPVTSNRKIHDRQPLPSIPDGDSVSDDCPSPPTKID
ncbi:MAG: hypothetical protein ABIQ07_05230 [Ginsengibacter sp.]